MANLSPAQIEEARLNAGWQQTSSGWVAACGTPEDVWKEAGYAMPEEPLYVDWRASFIHYEPDGSSTPLP